MRAFKYRGVIAQQSAEHRVITVAARVCDIVAFARVERAGRGADGTLCGFQRPQIASHIREIREYLRTDDAVLPNPVVVAFVDGVSVREISDGVVELTISIDDVPRGFVVDGQQRLAALLGLPDKQFDVFVSVLLCRDQEELRKQFVLINSTRPLPKALIYELLPSVASLPPRLSKRSFAAALTERLNFDPKSSLQGMIYQHTNPTGIIRDTSLHKVVMQSVSDGAMREFSRDEQFERGFDLISQFFAAVKAVFADEWEGHTPKTSRLVHGAGVIAMGFVMELLVARDGASTFEQFKHGLGALRGKTAWTSGSWRFSESELVPWNAIENTPRQILALSHHLVSLVRRSEPMKSRITQVRDVATNA